MVLGFLAGAVLRAGVRRILPVVAKRAAPVARRVVPKAIKKAERLFGRGVTVLRSRLRKPPSSKPKVRQERLPIRPVRRGVDRKPGRPLPTPRTTRPRLKKTPRTAPRPTAPGRLRTLPVRAGRAIAKAAPTAAAVGVTALAVKDLMPKKPAPQPQQPLPPAVTFPKKPDMEPGAETPTPPAPPQQPPSPQAPPSPPAGEELTGMPGLPKLLQQWGAKIPSWAPLLAGAGVAGLTMLKGGGKMVDLEGLLPDIGVPGPGVFGSKIAPEGGQVVAAWVANGVPFVRLADGRICAQKKDGTVKCWRPFKPTVFGKKIDARKFARLAKKYRKTYQELHRLFGRRSSRRRCR